MADFSQLPGNQLSYLSDVSGCAVARASNTTATIGTGQVRDSTNAFDILVSSTLTVNFAANGANGLDTGTFAASTGYYLFVLYDATQTNGVASLASLSATAPTMPSVNGVTYSHFRCVGWVLADGSVHLLAFTVTGTANVRRYEWNTPIAVLTAGTSATAADVSLATAVPATNYGSVNLQTAFTPNAAADTFSLRAKVASAYSYVGAGAVAAVVARNAVDLIPSTSSSAPTITYILSTASAALTLSVRGFQFNI